MGCLCVLFLCTMLACRGDPLFTTKSKLLSEGGQGANFASTLITKTYEGGVFEIYGVYSDGSTGQLLGNGVSEGLMSTFSGRVCGFEDNCDCKSIVISQTSFGGISNWVCKYLTNSYITSVIAQFEYTIDVV